MVSSALTDRWAELGPLLAARRVQIDARYRVRKVFAAEVSVHSGVLRDIEIGARDNFSPATLSAVEGAYQLQAGSIRKFLDGKTDELPAADAAESGRERIARADEEQVLAYLRNEARSKGKTLGEILLERDLATPEELTVSDQKRNDPVVREILESDLSDETKGRVIAAYASLRRDDFRDEGLT
ncbi:hypothetical protein [Acrocarpospora sp. B8E8]|uniref:hypothetical protein n=1 Tax=Acrocarpospora sp. B8E8 TaxID=3153572 RepID=UPI00325E17FD